VKDTIAGYAIYSEGNIKVNSGLDFGTGFGDSAFVLTADGEGNCDWQGINFGGIIGMNELTDVDTAGVIDGQVLKWISVAGEWRPANDVGGATGADNWGTQVVTHNTSLSGDGTPVQPLGIQWNTLKTYINDNIILNDLKNVNTAGSVDGQILTWVGAANQWRPTALDSGSLGDNWGTQIVQTDTSLFGDGTAGDQLGVNWDTLANYATVNWTLNDLVDVEIDTFSTDMVLSWDNEDRIWKPAFNNDMDMENELIDSITWFDRPLGDTLHNVLRIVEHSVENDVYIPADLDYLGDNSLNDLNDVNSASANIGDLLQWSDPNWSPISSQSLFNDHFLGDLGNVNSTPPDSGQVLQWNGSGWIPGTNLLEYELGDLYDVDTTAPDSGQVLEWNSSEWIPGTNVSSLINTWQDHGGYLAPLTHNTVEFNIYDADSAKAVRLFNNNNTLTGTWYGMYIERKGASNSDGYGTYSLAGTSEGVSAGSEFYGVYGKGHGGARVYGLYGDGDEPGTGGEGYGLYARGISYGVYGYGTGANSYGVYGWAPTGFAGYFVGPKSYISGKVGIGTESPMNKVDIEGATAIGASYSGSSTAPSNGLIVEGNVGIGTDNPECKLEIAEGGLKIKTDNYGITFYGNSMIYKQSGSGLKIKSDASGIEFLDHDSSHQAIIKDGRIKDRTGYVMPVGTIVPYGGTSAPEGWFLCDGSVKSRTTYAELFSIIETSYGTGNGTSTFNLPNLKGRIPVGYNSSDTDFNTLGETGGEKAHTLSIAEMPTHSHTISSNGNHNHRMYFDSGGGGDEYHGSKITVNGTDCGSSGGCPANGSDYTEPSGSHTHTIYNSGDNGSHNNIQPYQVVNYIIKY